MPQWANFDARSAGSSASLGQWRLNRGDTIGAEATGSLLPATGWLRVLQPAGVCVCAC